MKHAKKGAAATSQTVLLILIMIAIFGLYIFAVREELNKRTEINFDQASVQKIANTFNLVNRSLATTWYVSSVQSTFATADSSIDCGYDDPDTLPNGYWYRFDRQSSKEIKRMQAFFGGGQKYNNFQPSVCYPNQGHMLTALGEKFIGYQDIKYEFDANGLDVEIDDRSMRYNFFSEIDGIKSETSQDIKIKERNGFAEISSHPANKNKVYTALPRMIDAGRSIVLGLSNLSDGFTLDTTDSSGNPVTNDVFDFAFGYQDNLVNFLLPGSPYAPDNYTSYLERIENYMQANLIPEVQGANKRVAKDKFRLDVSTLDDRTVFAPTHDVDAKGVVFNYDIDIIYSDGVTAAGTCQSSEHETLVEAAVRAKGEWKFTDTDFILTRTTIEFSQEEIIFFVKAIIQRESNWDPRAVSCAGAAGLGQLINNTAIQYGLFVPQYLAYPSITCGGRTWTNIESCNRLTPNNCDLTYDERFNPQRNVEASVNYIYYLFGTLIEYTRDRDELLRFVMAAYNGGEGRVINRIQTHAADSESARFDEIKPYLPQETREYIDFVSANFVCYGGFVSGTGDYYYHDQASNRFYKKPVSLTIKAADGLPAIDCTKRPYSNVVTLPYLEAATHFRIFSYYNDADSKLACCGDAVWSCNANIAGVPAGHALTTGQYALDSCQNELDGLRARALLQCTQVGFFPSYNPCLSIVARGDCQDNGCFWNPSTGRCYPPDINGGPGSASTCTGLGVSQCTATDGCYFVSFPGTPGACYNCPTSTSCSAYGSEQACAQCSYPRNNCQFQVSTQECIDVPSNN